MNKEQILELSGRELDGEIAEYIFGYTHGKTPKDYDGLNGGEDILLPPNIKDIDFTYPPKGKISKYWFVPNYSTQDSYMWAYEVEEKIKSMYKCTEYTNNLNSLINGKYSINGNLAFKLLHAAPIDRLRAALLTLEGVKE